MKNVVMFIMVFFTNLFYAQTYEEVRDFIYDSTGIKHKEIVLRQAILETGWFESYNCRVNHNLFGFWSSKRKEYYTYDNWKESIWDYDLWQRRHYKGGDYYTFLTNIGYATDPDYIKKLKGIKLR